MNEGNNQPGGWKQRDLGELLHWKRLPGWSQLVAVHAIVGVGNLTIAPAVKPPPTRSECF